jgi:hypothetical protein
MMRRPDRDSGWTCHVRDGDGEVRTELGVNAEIVHLLSFS